MVRESAEAPITTDGPVTTGRIAGLRQHIVDDEPLVHSIVTALLALAFTAMLLYAAH
jgi:hypothetical protein